VKECGWPLFIEVVSPETVRAAQCGELTGICPYHGRQPIPAEKQEELSEYWLSTQL